MKMSRQNKILSLIQEHPINRQEDLLAYLKKAGFDVTQATVSRDIRELNLVKVTHNDVYCYAVQDNVSKNTRTKNKFNTIFREAVISCDLAMNIVVVKCYSGMANAACDVFDIKGYDDVVGTLAGDNTFIIIMRSEAQAKEIYDELSAFIQSK